MKYVRVINYVIFISEFYFFNYIYVYFEGNIMLVFKVLLEIIN